MAEEANEEQLEEVRALVEQFLDNSPPEYWVNWYARCTDSEAKNLLRTVLLEGEHLRTLTDPEVKAEVLDTIATNEALMKLVVAEIIDLFHRADDSN